MESRTYGYIRVSGMDHNKERQFGALQEKQVPEQNIFVDQISGKDSDQTGYKDLVKKLKKGDLLYIVKMDSLGKCFVEIREQWRFLTKKIGVDICVIEMPLLDTRICKDRMGSFIADLVFQILSFVVSYERESVRKRQEQGIAAAKARGVRFGRPEKKVPEEFPKLVEKWEKRQMSLSELLAQCRISETTFYRRLRELRLSDTIKNEKIRKDARG